MAARVNKVLRLCNSNVSMTFSTLLKESCQTAETVRFSKLACARVQHVHCLSPGVWLSLPARLAPSQGGLHATIANVQSYHNHKSSNDDGDGHDCCCSGCDKSEALHNPGPPCWKCGRQVDDKAERYFCTCGVVQPPLSRRSLFDIMGVKETFDVDLQELTEKYRKLQRLLHPDKYSQKSETEKEFSAQHSSMVNRAYNTLQKPLDRGLYLLHLNEDSLESETELSAAEFLDEILSVNEQLIEAETAEDISTIGSQNQAKIDELVVLISEAFKQNDTEKAKHLLLRLKYYANVAEKVKESLQKLV